MFYRLPGRAIGEVTRMLQKKGGLVYGGVINSKITLSGKVCSVFDLGAVTLFFCGRWGEIKQKHCYRVRSQRL